MKAVSALMAACAAVSCGVMAQTMEEEDLALAYGDKATVSIATGEKQSLRRAPAVATVITAEDIAAMGATDLDEVMETVPGVHVGRSSNFYAPLYIMRGIYSQYNAQTLMLVNGVPMTTLLVGNRGNIWGGLPLENIARIEIIRGPGSALYGADAFAGVINIITKTAGDVNGTQVGVRLGEFRTKDAWMLHGGQSGGIDVSAYLRVGKTDGGGETITADQQTRFDTLNGTRVSLAPGATRLGRDAIDASLSLGYENWRLNIGYKERDDVETGAGVGSALDPVGKAGSRRFHADLSWTNPNLAQNWGGGATASYLHYAQLVPRYFQLFPAGSNQGNGAFGGDGALAAPQTWENQIRLSGYLTYSGFDRHKLRLGVGHDDLDMYRTSEYRNFTYAANGTLIPAGGVQDYTESAPFMRPHRRKVDYLYLQDEWHLAKDWTLTAGARIDKYTDVGTTRNPRLALVWDAAYNLTAKVMYGTAFRAPSFAELYSITNPVSAGNSQLKPERIRTLEGGVTWQARPDTQFTLTRYYYRITNLILAVANASGAGSTYQNTGDRSGSGTEIEVAWDATRSLRLSGNYSYQRSIDIKTNMDSGYAPQHHFHSRADWRFASGWLASAQVNWVADRKRPSGDRRPEVPDYKTVDLSLRTARSKDGLEFSGAIRNLFNTQVIEPSLAPGTAIPYDLPQPRRSFFIQAIQSL